MGDREKDLATQLDDLASIAAAAAPHDAKVLRRAANRLRDLERWNRAEEAFYQTRLGAMFSHMKGEFMQCELERKHYRDLVMDWTRLQPDPAVIREAIKPRVEAK